MMKPKFLIAALVLASAAAMLYFWYPGPGIVTDQESFPTAEAAAQALLNAAARDDTASLNLMFGRNGKEIINSGDPVQDKQRRVMFVEMAQKSMNVRPDPDNPKRSMILIGDDEFPFPAPIVKTGGRWRFDVEEGKREMLARRIGANELDAIELCRKYVDAQFAFAAVDHDGSGVHQYAQRFISSPDKKDGLYWPAEEGSAVSPINDLVNQAAEEGYDVSGEKPVPYHGYKFQILTGQGSAVPGGERDYLVHGLMIGGFGLVAWPVEYGASGIKSFLVSQSGVVYEKDLGTKTAEVANAIKTFNPDSTWKAVE